MSPRSQRFTSQRAAWLGGLAVLAILAAVATLWSGALTWSSTASPILDGLGGEAGPNAALGRALRGLGTTAATRGLWAGVACANAALALWLGRQLNLGVAVWALVPMWLALGPARRALSVVGTEGPLLLASQLALVAGFTLRTVPVVGAACLALALALAATVSPSGLLMTPILAVVAALTPRVAGVAPRPASPSSGGDPSAAAAGVRVAPVALGWAAGVLAALAILRLAFPEDALGHWWTAQIDLIRRPLPALVLGGWADLPGVGGPLAEVAQWPAVVAGLAFAAWRQPTAVGPLVLAAAWALSAGLAGAPLLVDAAAIATPLLVLPALLTVSAMARAAGARAPIGLILLGSLLLAAVADAPRTAPAQPYSALGRALPIAADPTATRPAVLLPTDLTLLAEAGVPARVLPDRRGARRLLAALRRLRIVGDKARDWDAFSARYVMIRRPAVGPVARAWRRSLPEWRCSASACLLTMADGPQGPR